jgi:long-chain acyl-CoA synthetase
MLVQHLLEDTAARLPNKASLICGGEKLTYADINTSADKLAAVLTRMGSVRQDRIVIFMDASAETIISLFGVLKAGCIFIIVHPDIKAAKLNFIIKDSAACTLIAQGNKASIVHEAIKGADGLKRIIWVADKKDGAAELMTESVSSYTWTALMNGNGEKGPGCCCRNIDLDIATIIYTSGSTGEPKGVISAHSNVVSAVRSITTYMENVEQDIILNTLPLSFDYGLYQVLMAFSFGGTVVLEKSFAFPYKIMETIEKEHITGFPIVPTMIAILLRMKNLCKFDLSSLRYITNTAAALPVAHIKKMQSLFPNVKVFSMYGLTECKRVSYLPPEYLGEKPDSVGVPIPNEEVFIVDEAGNEVAPNEIGELVVRGANVMCGYWNAPEETAKAFRPGSKLGEVLLYTGDLFRRDEEGFLYFVGRKDDMIKSKGERISPKEIENVLCELGGVAEAAVIGVPDEILGSAIKAFVIKDSNARITEKDVIKYCASKLEPFRVPKYIVFVERFQKTCTGKIDKKLLCHF